jgi:hypothetical protein
MASERDIQSPTRPIKTVFVSSVMAGFDCVRRAAREAIESVRMQPIMAELGGASAQSAQRALLDEVARADVYLLVLGGRYGTRGESGLSPTEEEFEEAVRRGIPILIMRQEGEMEPDQRQFLERAGGRWEEGRVWDTFTDERDLGMKIVRALARLQDDGDVRALAAQAQRRASTLARGERPIGYSGFGARVRIALAPVIDLPLLDDVALDEPALPGRLAELARSTRVVPQVLGIESRVSGKGVSLTAAASGQQRGAGEPVTIDVARDGAIVVEGSVSGDDPHFGSSRIDPERLEAILATTSDYAISVWRAIDPRSEIQQVAAAIGIPEANGKVFGRPSRPSNSFSYGGMSLPQVIIAPEPAAVVRRVDLTTASTRERLVAAVKRIFADANALETT